MPESRTQDLMADLLCSGDRPSVYAAGMTVAHALRASGISILAVDALGRVVIVPPSSVSVTRPVRVPDPDLDALEEGEAIRVMVSEGRSEDEMMAYLKRRG